MNRAGWRPRTCECCARPLETWPTPLAVDAYVGCVHCARLYLVTDDGLERVLVGLAPRELRNAFDELVEHWWGERVRDVKAAARPRERRAA